MNSTPLSLETLAVRVTALEQTAAKNSEDHGKIYSRMEAIETGHAVVLNNIDNIIKVCNEIKEDVKEIKEKPAKRYDMLINSIAQWLVLAILGVVNDPTTAGVNDSDRAMTYTEPSKGDHID